MREGPLEILDRARDYFLKSLFDGVDKADSAAEFFLSARSAQRKGYILSPSDDALVKMFYYVMKDDAEGAVQTGDMGMDDTGPKMYSDYTKINVSQHLAGQQLVDGSYQPERIMPPDPAQGLAGFHPRINDGDPDDPYANHDFFGPDFNPLHGVYHDHVGDFYVNPGADGWMENSQSQRDHHKELAWDEHNGQESNKFLLDASHYGNLDGVTNHSLYEQDFANWKINNDRAIASTRIELENQGLSDDEIDHQIALAHINEKKQEWKRNLGFWDYMFGMEWLTPEQRNMAYDHIAFHGTDDSTQMFAGPNTGHAHADWLPRFKRSFAQRFAGMYDHWVRRPDHVGSGIEQSRIRLPKAAEIIGVDDNFKSLLRHTIPGKGNAYDYLMEYLRERTGIEGKPHHGKPFIHTDSSAEKGGFEPSFANGAKTIQFRSTTRPRKNGKSPDEHYTGINREMLRLLLNIGDDGKIYQDGEHPLYSNWEASDSPLSQQEIDKILERVASEPKKKFAARIGMDESAMMVGDAIDHTTYPEYVIEGDEKPHETLSTYWQKPWMKGGMGKPPNQLFDLLHHSSLLYVPKGSKEPKVPVVKKPEGEEKNYGDHFEEMEERETGPMEYDVKRSVHGQEQSLLFARSKRHISPRYKHDSDGEPITSTPDDGISGGGILGMIANFAQPHHEFTRMLSQGKEQRVSLTGDAVDAPVNLHPHNVREATFGIKGHTVRANVGRHATALNPAFVNKLRRLYREARGKGNEAEADRIQRMLRDGRGGVLPVENAFSGSGGAYEFERKIAKNAHNYHRIGRLWGLNHAPLSPAPSIQRLGKGGQHTTYDEDDLGRISSVDPEGTSIQDPDDLANYLEGLDRQLKLDLANVERSSMSDEEKSSRKSAFLGEYERKKERLQAKYSHQPTPFRSSLMMNVLNPPALMTEEGDNRLTMRQAPEAYLSEHENKLNSLVDEAALIESQLEAGKRIKFDEESRKFLDEEGKSIEGRLRPEERDTPTAYDYGEELSDEERKELEHKLHEMNQEIATLDRMLEDENKSTQLHQNDERVEYEQQVHAAKAFESAAEHVKKMLGGAYEQLFDPNLPLPTLEANVRMFAKMVNDYLHVAPHESHGLTMQGIDEHAIERAMPGAELSSDIKRVIHDSPVKVGIKDLMDYKGLVEKLGLPDYDSNPHVQHTITNFLDMFEKKFVESGRDPNFQLPVMSVGQYLKATGKVDPDMDFEEEIEYLQRKVSDPTSKIQVGEKGIERRRLAAELRRITNEIDSNVKPFQGKGTRGIKADIDKLNEELGLMYHVAHNPDDRLTEPTTERSGSKMGKKSKDKNKEQKRKSQAFNTKQVLHSLLFSDPNIEPREVKGLETTQIGFGTVPIDAFGPNSHSVPSIYNSNGLRHEFGERVTPSFNYRVKPNGDIEITNNKRPMRLLQPLQGMWQAISPHLAHMLHPEYIHHDGSTVDALLGAERQGAHNHTDSQGRVNNMDSKKVGKSEIGLAALTNPDVIRKELGKEVPLLQPMHRIFKLEDLQHLRGFTGDWIVSVMPEGERGFVKKDDDEISAKPFTLSDEDKENFKKVTDNDFHADVIKTEEGYYIFDVIEYDDKEVHDTVLHDRIKILRGGMEGVENIHVPSASDTRLTDDAGLELIVEDLQKEHDKLLLRDAKSTYMVGEMRHPKWVMLNEGSDVVLRVLERRGDGPYTYRLGTGPITQEEDLGDRAVESGGETYMDVGAAFDSPDKYNEGDHVRVNISNVGETETANGQKLYTVSSSDIKEEAEGEGLVSQETLGMLAKSESAQWLCEVSRASSGVRITMPQGDVLYKCTQTGSMWTVHSPLASNSYLIRLSESQRQYWSPVAGALLKADLDIREEEGEESQFDESGDFAEPLIKPKKIKDTNWWDEEQKKKVLVKGLMLVEKLLKSGVGSVGQTSTGAMGLGIGYATPIESPTGPTNLHDSKTMPDFDNKERPGEDYTIEPGTDDEEPTKHITIPLEEGTLEVTSDSAVVRT